MQNQKVELYYGSTQSYENEKRAGRINENALYFIDGILYCGYDLYTNKYEIVDKLPTIGVKNVIYKVRNDKSVAIWDSVDNMWIFIYEPSGDSGSVNESHSHDNKSVLDKITQTLLDAWNSAVSHISDTIKHITSTERTNWNDAYAHSTSSHAPSNAQANVIEAVKVNGTPITPSSKEVDITVPSVGNGTITITQNGTTKGTFTTNQSGNTTVALTDNNTTYSVATQSADGLESAEDKKKLDGIATGAEVNQNAFSNVVVGSTTISADSKTDTLTLVSGDNVTITPDENGDKITISSINTDTTYSPGAGISLDGNTFSNSGVRSIATGGTNGTISVDTNGTSTEVAIKGLGSAAYTSSSAYVSAETGTSLQSQITTNANAISTLNSNLTKYSKPMHFYNVNNTDFIELWWDGTNGGIAVRINGAATALFTVDKWL